MRIRTRLFAMLRERAGWRERNFELPPGQTRVADAWELVAADAPALAGYRGVVRFAVNGSYASPDDSLSDGDELAIIPPVAGGAAAIRCALTAEPIADELLAELRRTLPTTRDGALAIFVGQARETPGLPAPGEEDAARRHAGEPVSGLDYEAFEEMALTVLREICAEAADRFGASGLVAIHRVGRVGLSEPSVVVAAAAGHRGPAFDACRYVIDELKSRAPIWKRERYASGEVWIGGSIGHEEEQA
jgi:MoaE-MoaD fusion protein